MITQSFLYNAIFFTYALVLTKIYGVSPSSTACYFMFFAAGNLMGPLTIGRLFDTIGRRRMIGGTYLISGIPPRRQRVSVQGRGSRCLDADPVLVRDLLLRFSRCERRVSHGE
jgi:MFS family permease